jgi:hypothetical protein
MFKALDPGHFLLIGGGAGARIGGGVAFGCGARGEVENREGIFRFPPLQWEKGSFLFGTLARCLELGFGVFRFLPSRNWLSQRVCSLGVVSLWTCGVVVRH